MIDFFVQGIPKPGGSKKPCYNPKTKRRWVRDDCEKTKDWMALVNFTVSQLYHGEPLAGPLKLEIQFVMPRPKNHYRGGNRSKGLRANAPYLHTNSPDLTKILRSTEDALKGILWFDDKQICRHGQGMEKVYGEKPGALIRVEEITDDRAAACRGEPTVQEALI